MTGDSTTKCDYLQRVAARYIELLVEENLWPLNCWSHEPLSVIVRKIGDLAHPEVDDIPPCKEACASEFACLRQHVDSKFEVLKKHAQNLWAGLCLECFKESLSSRTAKASCRIAHEQFLLKQDEE